MADGHGFKPASQVSSESWDRILPRLARDAPEVLERVKAGDNRHTLAEPSLDIVKTTDQGDGGNSAAYLAARLKEEGALREEWRTAT